MNGTEIKMAKTIEYNVKLGSKEGGVQQKKIVIQIPRKKLNNHK